MPHLLIKPPQPDRNGSSGGSKAPSKQTALLKEHEKLQLHVQARAGIQHSTPWSQLEQEAAKSRMVNKNQKGMIMYI